MNEREEFHKFWQSSFTRIQTMTEAQVVDGLRSLRAARNMAGETLAFLHSVSLVPTEDSGDEMNKLRSDLNSYPHPSLSPDVVFDYIEDALKKRLETLRRKGK
jgi:hypothetical protein